MSPRLIAPYGCFAITLSPPLRLLVPYGLVAITVSSAYGDCVVRTLQCYGGTLLLASIPWSFPFVFWYVLDYAMVRTFDECLETVE